MRNDSKHKATAQTSVLGLLIPSVLSGLVCGLIIFVFCCVFSSMIFQQPGFPAVLESAVPLGVGMHTVSTMAGALVFAKLSACKAVMAGPDLNPVVFIAEGTAAIVESMCPGGTCPAGMDEKLVPTVLAGCFVATALVGLTFLLLGVFRLTGVVGFVPANVTAGFLSCIGWKVIKASLEVRKAPPARPQVAPDAACPTHRN